MKNYLITLLVLLLLLASAGSAQAQEPSPGVAQAPTLRSSTSKLFVGAQFQGATLSVEDEDETINGGGLALKLGYGFTPLITGYLGVSGSGMDDPDTDEVGLAFVEIGAQFNFRSGAHALVPYADVALSAQAYGNDDIMLNGSALSLGGGAKYFFSPKLALDGGLFFSFGNFDEMEVDGDREDIDEISTTSARLNVGIAWYPLR